jgi:serine/threonine protein kinase
MMGRTISHYQLQSKLGQGGMGIVYRAIDTRLGRVVALKMIPPDALGREDLSRRMLREAHAAAMLNHPNVCALYDVNEAEGFLVMECIEGAPLNEVLRAGPLAITRAMDIARQIASGLAAAHHRGIVHRDIKPANILLTPTGQVKITDFGLARCGEDIHLTLTGQLLGTPAYMSPEQIRGTTADERSDIWSFGVVLYEMLTGSLPFRGPNTTALLYSIVNDEPIPIPASLGPQQARCESVIDRCLAKSPDNRYQRITDIGLSLGAGNSADTATIGLSLSDHVHPGGFHHPLNQNGGEQNGRELECTPKVRGSGIEHFRGERKTADEKMAAVHAGVQGPGGRPIKRVHQR